MSNLDNVIRQLKLSDSDINMSLIKSHDRVINQIDLRLMYFDTFDS